MTVKTRFEQQDFERILGKYDLGAFTRAEPIPQGTVQTNYFLDTSRGRFVLRFYEVRSRESVLFESHLLAHLAGKGYPCPLQIENIHGAFVGSYRDRPIILFERLEGRPIQRPNDDQTRQLIHKAAELQIVTADFASPYVSHRWNYSPELCRRLAQAEADKLGTPVARQKMEWLQEELARLELPDGLPKGICHCDFHFSNVLFQGVDFAALLDFDDANYTYRQFDLVGLMEHSAWPHSRDLLDLQAARWVVQEYSQLRPLPPAEQEHLFDVYRLSILFDCVWYFGRGGPDDFREKRKVEALNTLGRRAFIDAIFHE